MSVPPSVPYVLDTTIDKRTLKKLRRLQRLLKSEIPSGDPSIIFERALTLLVEEASREQTIRPGTG